MTNGKCQDLIDGSIIGTQYSTRAESRLNKKQNMAMIHETDIFSSIF